ncbi:hypothetical protein ACLB6G_13075 [Zhengella sp. ZM62]|uniref:hypothetical protein n=1 Tax=Zhengella sedimenti TaxID=3390035 RepID=UPI0039747E34
MSLLDANITAVPAETSSQFRVLTVVSIVLLALTVLWGFVDVRTIEGVPVWMKPLKFALSFVVLFGTIALVERRLSDRVRDGWTLRIIGWLMAAAFLSEMAYMMYQAGRAEPSHFNVSTPFHRMMYEIVMAAGAVSLVAATAVIGWVVKRDKRADLGPALREAIWLGFLLTFLLTMVVAGYLSVNGSHFVGLHPEGAPTMPFFGWSGIAGDLRPAHFASIHAMQALPLMAIWLDRRGRPGSLRTIRLAALGYSIVTVALFGQALLEIPLIPLR